MKEHLALARKFYIHGGIIDEQFYDEVREAFEKSIEPKYDDYIKPIKLETVYENIDEEVNPQELSDINRQIRKITKTKGGFNSDESLYKLVFLAYKDIAKKWKKTIPNWAEIISQLLIIFEDRLNGFIR